MPRYDFRCAAGHVEEAVAGYDDRVLPCPACGAAAERVAVPARVNIAPGAVPPMRERRIPLNRFVEAQGQMVRDAERTGTPAPDVLGIAQRQAEAIRANAPELVTGT